MPVLATFFGIIITMYRREHPPPHFHAWYAGHEITVSLATGEVMGYMPAKQRGRIIKWWRAHRQELHDNWQRARSEQPLVRIAPLEE